MSKLNGKRFVSMLLVIVMLFSMLPTGVLAEEVIEDSAVVISEEPTVAPTEEPTEAPTEEPTEAPTEEPTEAPTEEPTEAPTEEPTEAPTEEPTEVPTEEPVTEPTLYDQLLAKVDALLLGYLGEAFVDDEKTDAEILADVNAMSGADIKNAVAAMADGVFANLCDDILAVEKAAEELNDSEAAAVFNHGVYALLCAAAEERTEAEAQEPTEEPTTEPTEEPTEEPTIEPTEEPTEEPTIEPTEEPTEEPTIEPTEEPTEEPTIEPTEEPSGEETVTIDSLRAEIAAYIAALGITPDMPDQLLLYAYGNHESYEAAQASLTKQDEFIAKGMLLTEEEQQILLAETNTKLCVRYREVAENAYATMVDAECTVEGVKFATTSTNSNVTASGTTVTATVNGKDGSCGSSGTAYTMVLYITNTTGAAGAVSFDMAMTNVNSIYVGDANGNKTSESLAGLTKYTKPLAANESFSIIITTGANSTQNKLVMSNVTLVSASAGFTVTVEYPTAKGSVTSSVAGTSVDAEGTTTMTFPEITAVDGVTLTANSSSFLCWVDKDNKFLSKETSYTVNPSADTTVKAIMTGGNAYFIVNGNLYYGDLNEAVKMVETASNKTIVLANNGTLDKDCTIPSGVTLSIPCDTSDVERAGNYSTNPGITANKTVATAATAYRTLNIADGVVLTVKGSLSVAGNQSHQQPVNGSPVGKVGWIKLGKGSQIIVDGNLYVWGIIDGDGTVTARSTSTVYECFSVSDYRGGTETSPMANNQYGVFPMNQYTIPNTKVKMTIEAGAKEYGFMSVKVTLLGIQTATVPFIHASDGMFRLTKGSITKWLENGRLKVDVNGDMSVAPLKVSLGSTSIDSSKFNLPINNMMTVTVKDGANIVLNQNLALLPGSELTVEAGATAKLGSGKRIIVYDAEDFKAAYVFRATDPYSTEDAKVIINGTADLSAGAAYTTEHGANISGSGEITVNAANATDKETHQYIQDDDYYSITVTPGMLKNDNGADPEFTSTAQYNKKITYKKVDGVWTCAHTYAEGLFSEEVTTPATCEAVGVKTITCHCGEDSYTEEISALGHDYDAVVTAPTCTEVGYTTHTCKNGCGNSYTDSETAALGHTDETLAAVAPDCTNTGLTEGKKCSVCGEILVAQETVDALGHKYGEATYKWVMVDATETEPASASVTATRVCVNDENHIETDTAEATLEVVTAATCEDKGEGKWTSAAFSNNAFEAQTKVVEIAALGHDYVSVVTAPTCTEQGYTTHTCKNDETHVIVDTYVTALGHSWEWITDKEATVLEPGVKHEECSVCHEKRNENTEIPVLDCAHKNAETEESFLQPTPAEDATCTEEGNSAYWYCSACQKYFNNAEAKPEHEIEEKSWVIPAGHKLVFVEAMDPTCTEEGNVAHWHCEAEGCGMNFAPDAEGNATEEVQENVVIGKLDHTLVKVEAIAATCQAEGKVAHWHCEVENCGMNFAVDAEGNATEEVLDTVVIPVNPENHIWGEGVVTTEPTCTAVGEMTYTCTLVDVDAEVEGTLCSGKKTEEVLFDAELYPKNHAWDEGVVTTEPTCQKEGVKTFTCTNEACTVDGVAVTKTEPVAIDPDAHQYEGKVTIAATCQAEGEMTFTCINEKPLVDGEAVEGEDGTAVTPEICGDSYTEVIPVDPEGHVWDEGVPFGIHSCNASSYIIYTCTLCETENKVVDREQHFRIPIGEEIPATCTEDGMTSGWKCEKCDEFWIPQEVIPALGHEWGENLPCLSDASACARCDLKYDTKQDHLVVEDPEIPATCTETGLTEGSHCGWCNEILVEQTVIPVTDHTWTVADEEIPATCNTQGHKEGASYCLICDYDADPIPQLEHEWMHRNAKKATYSAIGWNAHDYCLICKTIKTLEQYESDPCEFCGENPEGYVEIPMVEIQQIETVDEFLRNIGYLELMAEQYAKVHPGADPLGLVLNYMRTGVENYTSGSWAIMAGPEDKDFLKYVQEMEDAKNSDPSINVWVNVSGLKKLKTYESPSNEKDPYNNSSVKCLSGHFFGTMDMTYHNKGSQNHADVGGWVGDLVDLLSTTDQYGVDANLTLEEKIAYVHEHYLFSGDIAGSAGSFGSPDLFADLDAYYIMNELITKGYETGDLEKLMREYYQPGLTLEKRVSYLLTNRLDALSTRQDLRTAVYNAYTSNKLITTLEGTRNFNATGTELTELRKAVCYAFADEMCRIAGDYVEDLNNPRFTVFDSETKILAPGITQMINYATNADGKQIVYYVATADVKRDDVGMWVNYYDRDPGTPENPIWKNNSVPRSAQNAQDRYGDPNSEDYIENFNVIASTNAGGYSMQDDATPGGLIVMNGIEWYPQKGSAGFFAILDDGTAYMGTAAEYNSMKGRIQEAIGGFGEFVVQGGQVVGSATYSDAPRTSVGITATGRVVIMCIDGRQAPFSSGASLQDVGYIMKEAGCVVAINLDGGGSTTFVARQPGSDDLTVMNRPSDGYPRNVSTNLLIYSTAPSSTKFDHAVIESEYDYATIGTPVQMTAAGVSPSGNAVDIPEGATWAVSDESWASITEDGVFTGKRLGEVYVYLMLEGKEIGSKLMTLTNPDQVYFEKAKVDAIYGSGVVLPLCARIGGKPIAINPNDVTITLSAPAAGTMDGFTFKAAESTVKTLTITASVSENINASINVMLYKQGENSFDFDKATGGDRMLAWDRQVSNAKVEDGTIYNVIDPAQDMVTSYTFALDMTAIPIPERLEELTYMLPGGTMDGANAWSFLLSLAQRISDLTWVKATVDFDDRFVVDYSNMKVLNDYFALTNTEFDETTNTLTVNLNWIKQSQVIDEATANPLCLINGIKLTPKDGVWTDADKVNVVTSGTIGYEIYMRASGLYSFAQKPENQAVFGLYPYRNPADTTDAGGYFRDTYAEITDEYTLVNVLKEGWVNEEGGFAYYVEGERLTGVQKVDGFYYDFGEDGINVGQTKYTGLFFEQTGEPVEGEAPVGVWHFIKNGELVTGWQSVNDDWYYFKDYVAVSGRNKVGGVWFDFEQDGKLVSGTWVNVFTGWRYYYGPTYYASKWAEIDGEWYYFRDGVRVTGYSEVTALENVALRRVYEFDEDGKSKGLYTGILEMDGKLYFIETGKKTEMGLFVWNGDYYYAQYDGSLIVNQRYYAWKLHESSELPVGHYDFGPDGRMMGNTTEQASGIVEKDGVLYYYENGQPKEKGLFLYEGNYYNSQYDGKLIVNQKYYVWKLDSTSELPTGHYEFGADGKMLQGIVDKAGVLYYYENGNPVEKGLFLYEGSYYNSQYDGKLITNQKYYVWKLDESAALPKGNYEFGPDGRMLQGIVANSSGVLYYYVNGNPKEMGLFLMDGYHYYAQYDGKLITSQTYYAWKVDSSSQLPVGHYEFAADGKVLGSCETGGEIVNKNGVLYYYENGKPTEKGLFKMGDNYYNSQWDGKLIVNQKYYVWKHDSTSDLTNGHYEFDEGGRMLQGIVNKNGVLYFYENGTPKEKGLFLYEGSYYNSQYDGKLIVNQKYYVWKHDSTSELPNGHYEFDAEGKMLHGIVDKNGVLYYYENGQPKEKGLFLYEGNYYNSQYDGKLIVNQKYYVWKLDSSSALAVGHYEFDDQGRVIGSKSTGQIVNKNGVLYYYESGKPVDKGLFYLDGYYYFAQHNGCLIVDQTYYVWKGNELLLEKNYTFNELGQIIR